MSQPQVLDSHVTLDGHLAGEALVRGSVQAFQEVAFLRTGFAAVRQSLHHSYTAGAAGACAAAEGDVGPSGVGNALHWRPGRRLHQQVLQEEVDLHHGATGLGSRGATSSTWPKGALSCRPRMRGRMASMTSSEMGPEERDFLQALGAPADQRLACQVCIHGDVDIEYLGL